MEGYLKILDILVQLQYKTPLTENKNQLNAKNMAATKINRLKQFILQPIAALCHANNCSNNLNQKPDLPEFIDVLLVLVEFVWRIVHVERCP